MKRRRNTGVLVLLIILAFMAFTIITQSVSQNRRVREFTEGFLRAYQVRNNSLLHDKYYKNQSVSNHYYRLMGTFVLQGWEITRINGQPYPLNTQGLGPGGSYIFNTVDANLYYKPVDKLVKPEGRYERVKHPVHGDSMVVPVSISYSYHPNRDPQWYVKPPEADSAENWMIPFEKPLPGPLESLPDLHGH
ncbi:MAG: hypothetical protein ACYDCO_14615 [Armatimonadota bacterium]